MDEWSLRRIKFVHHPPAHPRTDDVSRCLFAGSSSPSGICREFAEVFRDMFRCRGMDLGRWSNVQFWHANVSNKVAQPTDWTASRFQFVSPPVCPLLFDTVHSKMRPRFRMISNVFLTIGSCFSWNVLSNGYGRRGDVSRSSKIKQISKFPTLSRQLSDFNEAISTFLITWAVSKKAFDVLKKEAFFLDKYRTQENDWTYVIILVSIKFIYEFGVIQIVGISEFILAKTATWRCQVSQVVIWWVCCSLQYLGSMTAKGGWNSSNQNSGVFLRTKSWYALMGGPHELWDNYRKTSRWNKTLGNAM